MDLLTKEEVERKKKLLITKIKRGSIFIHPTDTVYGIGCSAINEEAVKKIREIKKSQIPFSIIIPGKKWIYENCIITQQTEEWIKKLPGPYTLILKLKNKNAISKEVNMNLNTIGIRYPNHWIKDFVETFGQPIVSTIIMDENQTILTHPEELHHEISPKVDFAIHDGRLIRKRSEIITFSKLA